MTAPDAPTGAALTQQRRILAISMRGIIGTLLVLVVAGVCVRLGIWQLDRLTQRRERNAAIEARLREPAVSLETAPRDSAGLTYRLVRVRGLLDHSRSIVLAGRSLRGAPGVHVLTPLRFADGTAILVNRGWVPSPDGASVQLDALPAEERIDAEGILLPLPGVVPGSAPSRSAGGARSGDVVGGHAFQRVWFRIDPVALRAQFPYAMPDVEVGLLPAEGWSGFPVRLPPPELDEGPHLGYALQWFSFAAIALIGWTALVVRSGSAEERRDGDARREASGPT